MSNKPRLVVAKKDLKNQISSLYTSLRESDDKLIKANENLELLESSYMRQKDKIKSITEKNLFLALISAFRLWRGERRS